MRELPENEIIGAARRLMNLPQARLAEVLGCSQVYISQYELGKTAMDQRKIEALRREVQRALPYAIEFVKSQGHEDSP